MGKIFFINMIKGDKASQSCRTRSHCSNKFKTAAQADNGLIAELKADDSWQRDGYLEKAGWVTFPGGGEPDDKVAEASDDLPIKILK